MIITIGSSPLMRLRARIVGHCDLTCHLGPPPVRRTGLPAVDQRSLPPGSKTLRRWFQEQPVHTSTT